MMQFGSEVQGDPNAGKNDFRSLKNPFDEDFIKNIISKQNERASITSFRARNTLSANKPKLTLNLATDIAQGPATSRERASNMFNFLPLVD